MAERHQLKVADDLQADDPFAELTRIMGFDPRKPEAATSGGNSGPLLVETPEDDFGVNLEQELMGEFEAEQSRAGAEPGDKAVLDSRLDHEVEAAFQGAGADLGHERQSDWGEWNPAMPQDLAWSAGAAYDRDVADALGDELASEILAGADASQSVPELDVEEFETEFARALEESAQDPLLESLHRTEDAAPGQSPLSAVGSEPDEESREFDWAAEEAIGDVACEAATESGHRLHWAMPVKESGPAPGGPEADGIEPHDAWESAREVDELEEHFSRFDLAPDETAVHPAAPTVMDASGEEDGPADAANRVETMAGGDEKIAGSAISDLSAEPEATVVYHAEQRVAHEPSIGMESGDDVQPKTVSDAAEQTAGEPYIHWGHGAEDADGQDAALSRDTAANDWTTGHDDVSAAVALPSGSASPAAAAAEQPAAEFSLEDELNALLGNIKAAGRISAATTLGLRSWAADSGPAPVTPASGTTPRQAGSAAAPLSGEAASSLPYLGEMGGSNRTWIGEATGAGEDLEEVDDEAIGAALAEDLQVMDVMSADTSVETPFAHSRAGGETDGGASGVEEAPVIETVEVADRAVALADDLDIPDIDFDRSVPEGVALDDLDAEFASLLNEMNLGDPGPSRPAGPSAPEVHDVDARHGDAGALSGAAHQHDAGFAFYEDDPAAGLPVQHDEDYAELPAMETPGAAEPQRQRRGLFLAGLVGAVAVIGGAAALALSVGGSEGDVPAVVKADLSPVKVKPENPGGTTVPNQDSAVYQSVAGVNSVAEPQQEKLVTTAEEPIDVSPPVVGEADDGRVLAGADETMASPDTIGGELLVDAPRKSEDRIEQILEEAEADASSAVTAVPPRKVRTMIVRPDGTLVPREEPALVEDLAAAAGEATLAVSTPAAESEQAPDAAPPGAAAAVPPAAAAPATELLAATEPVAPADPGAAVVEEPRPEGSPVMPEFAPIAPQRPFQQPIDVVGEVKPDNRVAVAAPAAPASSADSAAWSVQIASQPNEAAARSTYQDLAGRYASVLAGHQVDIVKAEIAGRGTFWRVRLPTSTRNEAIRLCESYKDAGGNCFVSR